MLSNIVLSPVYGYVSGFWTCALPIFSSFFGGYFEKIPRGVGGGGITLGKKVNRK